MDCGEDGSTKGRDAKDLLLIGLGDRGQCNCGFLAQVGHLDHKFQANSWSSALELLLDGQSGC